MKTKEFLSGIYLVLAFTLLGAIESNSPMWAVCIILNLLIAGAVFNKCIDKSTLDNVA